MNGPRRPRAGVAVAALLGRSRLVVAEGSGHRIQEWRPDLVADAIREVVDASGR